MALAALSAAAQLPDIVVEMFPPAPTAGQYVTLRFQSPNVMGVETTREGNHFRFQLSQCYIICIVHPEVTLGPLAEGTYTYEMFIENAPSGTGSFVVAPAAIDVPALSPYALGVLSALLAAAGWLWIGRRG